MLYHASSVGGIEVLQPRIADNGMPLIYFSRKRENVLVYLVNAVERYCRETGFAHEGTYAKWGPYGFGKDGRLELSEYYPNALEKTYRGASGYIYCVEDVVDSGFKVQIPDVVTSSIPVPVSEVEYVPDAYEAILEAERNGLITIARYGEQGPGFMGWLEKTITAQYAGAEDLPEYRHFLRGNFPDFDLGKTIGKSSVI